ncbi:MAG: MFS transporter [Chloroflexota bacterium]
MTARGGRLGALGEPQFRLLLIGQAASAFGDALIPVAIAFAVLSIGGSAIELGYVFAAFTASHLVLVLAGGVWADRLPRQLVMVGCDVVRTVAEVVLAVLLLTGTAEVWHLVLVVTVVGGAGAFFVPASSGLVPQVISPGRLQEANALMGLSRNATGIFGPPIAGLLVVGFGTGIVFLVDAATFAVSAVSLLMLRVPARGAPPAEHPRFLADLAEGWREVTSRPWLLAAISTFAVTNMASAPIFILGPVVADTQLGGAAAWGFILTGGAIGGLVGSVLALRIRPRRPLMVGFAISIAQALPLLAFAVPLPVVLIAIALFVSLTSIQLANTWWFTLLQQHIPERARSRVSSYDWLVSLVFQPAGYMLAGPLSSLAGLATTLLGAAGLSIVANLRAASLRSIREVRWVEASAPDAAPDDSKAP